MEKEQNGDIGSFLAGFVIGGLVGAAVALILAPQSGEETRNKLAVESAHLREAGTERLHAAQESVSHVRERAQETATQVQEQARIVLDEGKSRLEGSSSGASPDETAAYNGDTAPPSESGETG